MAGMTETKPGEEPYSEEMRQLLHRAQQGHVGVLPQRQELLDQRPGLWQRLGDLAAHVEEALLGLAAGRSLLARESIRRRMEELRAELSVAAPTPVERLLIDRVVVCWAVCHLAELDDLQRARSGTPQGCWAQRRLNATQARYLAALKQLVVVRKLLKPTTLELLKYPVAETAADGTGRQPARPSRTGAAAAR